MAKKKTYNITKKRAARTLGEEFMTLLINHSSKHQASKKGYKHEHKAVFLPAKPSISPSEYRRQSKKVSKSNV
jgi:hypothetical protein